MSYFLLLLSMDNEVGDLRRQKLNWTPQDRIVAQSGDAAPEAFKRRFRFMHTAKESTRRGIVGCAWSHILALRKIVEEDLENVVVLEDDAHLVGPLPPLHALPKDAAVHFGGSMRTPGSWLHQRAEFPPAVEEALWCSLQRGLNRLEGFSVIGSEACYIPNAKVAKELLDIAEDPDMRMMHWDLYLRAHKVIRFLWFPNCFSANDAEHSQVEGRRLLRHLYADGPRKIAAREAFMQKSCERSRSYLGNGGLPSK